MFRRRRNEMKMKALLLALTVAGLAMVPTPSQAGTYVVWQCWVTWTGHRICRPYYTSYIPEYGGGWGAGRNPDADDYRTN
jgi:hypothetical protein